MNFHERFCDLCAKRKISPSKACREMGMSASSVRRWNDSIPRESTLAKMAQYFGVETRAFICWALDENEEIEISPVPPVIQKRDPDKSVSALATLNEMMKDPVMAAYLRIYNDSTPEQREYLTKVMNELQKADMVRNAKNNSTETEIT